MWFGSILKLFPKASFAKSSRQPRSPAEKRRRARRLLLEPLDARCVLAFSPFSEYVVGSGASVQVAGEFTGDGYADLVTSTNGGVQLVRGNGDGSFQAPVLISPNSARSVAAGDLNADGNLDLVTNREILLGNGNGTFQPPLAINLPDQTPSQYGAPLPQQALSVAVGDLNDDGKLDAVVTGMTTWQVYTGSGYYGPYYTTAWSGHANVLLGNGDGTLTYHSAQEYSNHGYVYEGLKLVDLNHDDALDLLIARQSSYNSVSLLGNGDGSFTTAANISSGEGSSAVNAGDFDEDGHVDLITRTYNGFMLNRGRGDGTFEDPAFFTSEPINQTPQSVAVGDVNADGHLDIVYTTQRVEVTQYVPGYWGDYPSDGFVHNTAKVVLGTGEGTFTAPIGSGLGTYNGLYALLSAGLLADFNSDGRPDFAIGEWYSGRLTAALNDGNWDPPAAARIADVTIVEGHSGQTNALITVTLAGDHDGVSVDYSTSDYTAVAGNDYVSRAGTLTFAPGVFSQTIEVPIIGDRLGETTESFFVTLLNPSEGAVLIDQRAVVSILDDEPTISIDHPYGIDPLTVVEGDSGTTPAVFTVTLSQPYDQEVTVHYYTLTGNVNDIIPLDDTLRFAPGETSKTITVEVVGDLLHEDLEAFNVYLDTPSANASLGNASGYCYIVDNDPLPTVSIGDVSKNEGNSGTTKFNFTLTLSAPSGNWVTVTYETVDGTATTANGDYVFDWNYAYFEPGQTTSTISIDVKGDRTNEPDETFFVNLIEANGAAIEDGQGVGTIVNDDGGTTSPKPQISIGDAQITEGNSGSQQLVFTVSLSQASTKEVSVNYATANGTAKTGDNDYVSKSGTLRFAPGETTKTISITIKGDTKVEADETFKVKLSSAKNAEIADSQAIGSILNDDTGSSSPKPKVSGILEAFASLLESLSNRRKR
jgi:hypothetical protein